MKSNLRNMLGEKTAVKSSFHFFLKKRESRTCLLTRRDIMSITKSTCEEGSPSDYKVLCIKFIKMRNELHETKILTTFHDYKTQVLYLDRMESIRFVLAYLFWPGFWIASIIHLPFRQERRHYTRLS